MRLVRALTGMLQAAILGRYATSKDFRFLVQGIGT